MVVRAATVAVVSRAVVATSRVSTPLSGWRVLGLLDPDGLGARGAGSSGLLLHARLGIGLRLVLGLCLVLGPALAILSQLHTVGRVPTTTPASPRRAGHRACALRGRRGLRRGLQLRGGRRDRGAGLGPRRCRTRPGRRPGGSCGQPESR